MYENNGSVDEQCDDSNTNTGDGCDASCQIETPVCGDFGFTFSPDTGVVPLTVT